MLIFFVQKSPPDDKFGDETIKRFSNCIPDDLILCLKQADQPKQFMGPPSKRTLNGIKPSNPVGLSFLKLTFTKLL